MDNIFDQAPKSPFKDEPEPKKRGKNRSDLTPSDRRRGNLRMYEMVEKAFDTLHDAMDCADFNTAVKAAQIILDRTGWGPKQTVDVNAKVLDLSKLSREELADRAAKLATILRNSGRLPTPPIDITPTSGTIQ